MIIKFVIYDKTHFFFKEFIIKDQRTIKNDDFERKKVRLNNEMKLFLEVFEWYFISYKVKNKKEKRIV